MHSFRIPPASWPSEIRMHIFMNKRKPMPQAKTRSGHPKHSNKCGALCCGSRLSTSSSSSTQESKISDSSEQRNALSSFAHAMVQARLEQMISNSRRRQELQRSGSTSRYVVLIAMDKSSYDIRRDFQESMMEVITSKGIVEPKELRSILNCYLTMNSGEHRQAIFEAFHEVCCKLFLCNR